MKKITIAMLLPLFLYGCATTYKPPAKGDVATIEVPKFETKYKLFGGFSGGQIFIAPEENQCGTLAVISKDKVGKKDITVKVASDRDVFISINRFMGSTTCSLAGVFSPEKDGIYQVVFGMGGGICGASVVKKNTDGTLSKTLLKRAYVSSFTGLRVCNKRALL